MKERHLSVASVVLFLLVILWGVNPAQAELTVGKTYDQTNVQEIQDLLVPSMLTYVKIGDYTIKVGKIDFSMKPCDSYFQLSAKNKGKYDINKDGILVEMSTGKPVTFVLGDPFPTIDPKDPKAAQKIMENFAYGHYRYGSMRNVASSKPVGEGGLEREIMSGGENFFYQNRVQRGQVPNPNNFLNQTITAALEPFDLRGSTSLGWTFNSNKTSVSFAYVPMLRRVRRTSAAARSDPYMGMDGCMDDMYGYGGKNAAMNLKLIGEKTILAAYLTDKKLRITEYPDGSWARQFIEVRKGYQIPGWKGAPWCVVDLVWVPREVWVIEMNPKDDYYNYGRQIMYIDKENFAAYFKEAYDRAGSFWKTVLVGYTFQVDSKGDDFKNSDLYHQIDSKTHHAGVSDLIEYPTRKELMDAPPELFGPQDFTTSAIIQRSK